LPNRYHDAGSLIGMAKEISRISAIHGSCGFKTNIMDKKYPHKFVLDRYKSANIVKVQTKHCFHYFGRIVFNVQNKISPQWLKDFVEFYGFNSINFLVDLANFVMIEYGAPLHIFDLDKIATPIYIRLGKKGERFISLENKEYKLLGEEIVIADKKGILGLAGIKGGKNSSVDLETKNIFIEAAVFDPVKIYSTSRKLNLRTDASFRFERRVAPIRSLQALERISFLIKKNLSGEILKGIIGKEKLKEKIIEIYINRLNKFSGINFNKERIRKTLKSLEIKIISETKNSMKLAIPLDRLDLETEEDIFEEIIRLYDLNKIPAVYEILPQEVFISPEIEFNNYLRKILTKINYNEIHNYSFFNDRDLDISPKKIPIEVLNPISENYKYFQTSLIPNLLKSVYLNQFYFKKMRFFEISKIAYYIHGLNGSNADNTDNINSFKYVQDSRKSVNKNPYKSALDSYRSVKEEYSIGICFAFKDPDEILKELKGVLNILSEELKVSFSFREFNQNQADILSKNKKIGIFELIPKKILEDYGIDFNVGVVELNVEELREQRKMVKVFEPWPIFPSIIHDLSFFIDEKIKFSEIKNEIENQKIKFLKEIKLVDVYFSNKKSLTLRIIFNHPERSLNDDEVSLEMKKIEEFLKEKYKITLR